MSWPSRRPPCRIAAGGAAHPEHQVLHLQRAEVLVVDGGDRCRGPARAGRSSAARRRRPAPARRRPPRRPREHLVDGRGRRSIPRPAPSSIVGVLDPLAGRGEPGLLGDVRPPDQAHHPLGDRGGAGRDRHPAAVAGQVGVARGVVGRPVAVPAGDRRRAGRRRSGPGRGCPAAAPAATGRSPGPRAAASRPGGSSASMHRVGAGRGRRRRRPARTAAASAARPPRRSGGPARSSPRPGCRTRAAWRTGPVCPKPVTRSTTSAGLISCSSLGAEAPLLQHAGPEVLDHHVGRARPAGAGCPGPPACRSSAVMVRLLRAITFHHRPCPSLLTGRACGPGRRPGARP